MYNKIIPQITFNPPKQLLPRGNGLQILMSFSTPDEAKIQLA